MLEACLRRACLLQPVCVCVCVCVCTCLHTCAVARELSNNRTLAKCVHHSSSLCADASRRQVEHESVDSLLYCRHHFMNVDQFLAPGAPPLSLTTFMPLSIRLSILPM